MLQKGQLRTKGLRHKGRPNRGIGRIVGRGERTDYKLKKYSFPIFLEMSEVGSENCDGSFLFQTKETF